MWRSSSVPIMQKDLLSFRSGGSSNERSHGLAGAGVSPKIGRISIEKRSHFCASLQSDSCSESYATQHDLSGQTLRAAAKRSTDGPQARRLLALAAIYDGANRTEAAEIGGVTLQIIRDWVMRFNVLGPDGLIDRKPPGQPSRLNDGQRQAIVRMIESGPIPAIHGVVRWRLVDLSQWIYEEFRITVAKQTLSRELRAMGYRKLSARPRHHAQAEGAIEDFKKSSQRAWMKSRAKRQSMLGK